VTNDLLTPTCIKKSLDVPLICPSSKHRRNELVDLQATQSYSFLVLTEQLKRNVMRRHEMGDRFYNWMLSLLEAPSYTCKPEWKSFHELAMPCHQQRKPFRSTLTTTITQFRTKGVTEFASCTTQYSSCDAPLKLKKLHTITTLKSACMSGTS